MVIRSCLLAFLLYRSLIVCAQTGPDYGLPKVIPPSPTASSLGKYGDVPVSLFSGLPGVSVPLFELSSKELSVPISISYHAAGVKVEDIAGWIGTGFSLNAGGAITRSIRGRPDEDVGRLTDGIPDTPTEQNDIWLVHSYAINQKDPEPDVYYYNFNGRSGQLMFDESGTFFSTGAEKIKFEKTLKTSPYTTWTLVDEQGTRYLFGSTGGAGVEETSTNGGDPNITAWYLTKMISADLSDTIHFEYTNKDELYNRPSTETYIWHNHPGDFVEVFSTGLQGDYNNSTYTNGNAVLNEISGKTEKAVFSTTSTRQDIPGGTELDKIRIYDKSGTLKRTYQFTYTSYQSRLFLQSVQEIGEAGEQKPPYKFTYNDPGGLPPTNSHGQDYWGYANGANLNPHLIPNMPADFVYTDNFGSQHPSNFTPANRNINEEFMKKGILTKIEYPTGGSTEFDFEPHEFLNALAAFDTPDKLELYSINATEEFSNQFTLQSPNVIIDIWFNDYREPTNYPRPVVSIQELVSGNWTNVQGQTYIWQPPYPCLDNISVHQSIGLEENHTYRLRITNEGCPTPPCNTPPPNAYTTHASITYFDDNAQYIDSGGGLRIKEIRNYAVNGGQATNLKRFEYDSGLLVTVPIFQRSFIKHLCGYLYTGQCADMSAVTVYSASSQSLVNLGTSQGSHVVYRKVREIYGANGENGYTESIFDITGLTYQTTFSAPMPPFSPEENVDYRRGKLLEQRKYNAAGDKLIQVTNTFKSVPVSSPNHHTIQGVRILQELYPSMYAETAEPGLYQLGLYNVTSRWVYQDSITQTSYYKNGSTWTPVTNLTRYFYDNPDHIQITGSILNDSEGNSIETKYWYSPDYSSIDNIPSILSKNIIALPIKQETHRNNQIISGKVNRLNADGKPIEIYAYESTSPQPPPTHSSGTIVPNGYNKKVDLAYDATTKNINKAQAADNVNTAYLWAYNTSYPIASVSNANATDVAATSFESEGKGNWTYLGSAYSDIPVKTGRQYYKLGGGNISRSLASGKYKLEYWSKCSSISLSGGTITTIRTSPADQNGWILYEKEVQVTTAVTLQFSGSASAFIDELRIYPVNAQMTTYTYDPVNGITSITDPNNFCVYYEYDAFGRLKWIKDKDGSIVKAQDYHYKAN
jgi:YD repeat-containing protein